MSNARPDTAVILSQQKDFQRKTVEHVFRRMYLDDVCLRRFLVDELVDADFGDVNALRNVVFHFRRGITPKDTDRLRRFRDHLRHDREQFAKEKAVTATSTFAPVSYSK